MEDALFHLLERAGIVANDGLIEDPLWRTMPMDKQDPRVVIVLRPYFPLESPTLSYTPNLIVQAARIAGCCSSQSPSPSRPERRTVQYSREAWGEEREDDCLVTERSMMRSVRWAAWVCAWSVLSLAAASAGEMSPLNLSPGFPTSLDDAYPVNEGSVVFQPTFRFDKSEDRDYVRARQTADLRWGVSKGLELFVGGTGIRGPELPGTMDDPRGARGGALSLCTAV